MRIAVLSLLDREVIDLDVTGIVVNPNKPAALSRCWVSGSSVPCSIAAVRAASGCDGWPMIQRSEPLPSLVGGGWSSWRLVPSHEQMDRRRKLMVIAVLVLLVVALIKLVLALERGHSNILFLILLAIASPFAVCPASSRCGCSAPGSATGCWLISVTCSARSAGVRRRSVEVR